MSNILLPYDDLKKNGSATGIGNCHQRLNPWLYQGPIGLSKQWRRDEIRVRWELNIRPLVNLVKQTPQ